MALPRAPLFLLLLSLSLLGGHPYPLGSTEGHPYPLGSTEGHPYPLDSTEGHPYPLVSTDRTSGLAGTQDTAAEVQVMPGHHQLGGSPAGARKAQKAAPAGAPVRRNNVPKALPGQQSPKMGRDSSCFGQRLDRIGSYSGLGCKVLKRP